MSRCAPSTTRAAPETFRRHNSGRLILENQCGWRSGAAQFPLFRRRMARALAILLTRSETCATVDGRSEMHVDVETWPALLLEAWKDTHDTLHMWTKIVGKIRLKLAPHLNHWWQVPLYLTSRGLTTTPIPAGDREFDVTFDFIDHVLIIQTSDGRTEQIPLRPQSVADFYREMMAALHRLAIDVQIWSMPSEVPTPLRLEEDLQPASYE